MRKLRQDKIAYATSEDDGLETLTENSDEGEEEQSVATGTPTALALCLSLESMCELDCPLGLGLFQTQEGNTHGENNERGDQVEGPFPDLLRLGPQVTDTARVELSRA